MKQPERDAARQLVDRYIKDMENINERRAEAAAKEMHYCMTESRLFNDLRQNLLMLDRNQLQEVIDGIPEDQQPVEKGGVVLHGRGKEVKGKARS